MSSSDSKSLLGHSKNYLQPLTLLWRINHVIPYLIGGTTFLYGSCQYIPGYENYVLGGWLFTIGSAAFLYADLNEWLKNNHVGCIFDADYRDDYENQIGINMESKYTCFGWYQRAENGLNFFFSAFGSFLYLVGSILFIPSLDAVVLGKTINM